MKTLIIDIDGTIVKYMGGGHKAIMEQDHELLLEISLNQVHNLL